VQGAGGNAVAWFNLMIEASLMGAPEPRLQSVQADLAAAQKSEPDRAMVLALVSLLGQKEIHDTRKKLAPVLRQIRSFLSKGSQITWTTAELQTIAELLTDLREFAVLLNYTRSALNRSDDKVARFYQIIARTGGNANRLGPIDEARLHDMLEDAAIRQNLSLFNRMQRFLFGANSRKSMAKVARGGKIQHAIDDDELAELLEAFAGTIPKQPAKQMRSLVNEYGRDVAIDVLAAEISGSPMGGLLSEEQARLLSGAIIANALQSGSQQAQRR